MTSHKSVPLVSFDSNPGMANLTRAVLETGGIEADIRILTGMEEGTGKFLDTYELLVSQEDFDLARALLEHRTEDFQREWAPMGCCARREDAIAIMRSLEENGFHALIDRRVRWSDEGGTPRMETDFVVVTEPAGELTARLLFKTRPDCALFAKIEGPLVTREAFEGFLLSGSR